VERYLRSNGSSMYIPEGALVAAALHLGFTLKPKEGTTSVYLNISNKTKIDGTWIDCCQGPKVFPMADHKYSPPGNGELGVNLQT
jgi:hypothetical protein